MTTLRCSDVADAAGAFWESGLSGAWGSPTCGASILPAADARSREQPRLSVRPFLGDVD